MDTSDKSGRHKSKRVCERVCGKHFVSGKPSPYWDKHNVDWVPTLELGKKSYGREIDYEERLQDSLPCPLKKKKNLQLLYGKNSVLVTHEG